MNIFSRFGISEIDNELSGYLKLMSSEMQNKISLWNDMAKGKAFWNEEFKPSGIIPSIVTCISDPVSEEIKITSENKVLEELMNEIDSRSPELVENLVTVGSSIIRPVYSNGRVQFEIIKNGFYIPISYDLDGLLTSAVILKKIREGKKEFMLFEKHDFVNLKHTVTTTLYRISDGTFKKASLTDCSQTEAITPVYSWNDVKKPFIVEIRNPRMNEIDDSPLPMALYGGHENLIEDCDRQYNELNYEQIAGRTRIFADEDLFRSYETEDGKRKIVKTPESLAKVIVKLSGNGTAEEKIQTHSPTLRTAQQIEAYQQILREIENSCRLGKGTISNLQEAPQTATAYKGGKQVLYNTINTIESEFEKKYHHIAYIFAYMLSAFENVPFNDEIIITYDESDRKDSALQRQEDIQEVNANIMNKWEYRMKHYGEDEETAKNNVPEVSNGGFVI